MAKMAPLEYASKFFELPVFSYPELDPKDGKPGYDVSPGWRTPLKADNYRNPRFAKQNWGPILWNGSIGPRSLFALITAGRTTSIGGSIYEETNLLQTLEAWRARTRLERIQGLVALFENHRD